MNAVVDPDESNAVVALMVGANKRVLELGCNDGSRTRRMHAQGCDVFVIDADDRAAAAARPYASATVVGDLETITLEDVLKGHEFDVIVAGGLLAYLRDPGRLVRACLQFLAPDGEVVVSIPNAAQADLRLALFAGHHEHTEGGAQDRTHLRLFTRISLRNLLEDCRLVELEMRRITRPIASTEIAPSLDRYPAVVDQIRTDPEAGTQRLICRSAPYQSGTQLETVSRRAVSLAREVDALRQRAESGELYRQAHRELMRIACPETASADDDQHTAHVTSVLHQTISTVVRDRDHLHKKSEYLFADRNRLAHELAALQESRTAEELRLSAELDSAHATVNALRRSRAFRTGQAVLSPLLLARRCLGRLRRGRRRRRHEA